MLFFYVIIISDSLNNSTYLIIILCHWKSTFELNVVGLSVIILCKVSTGHGSCKNDINGNRSQKLKKKLQKIKISYGKIFWKSPYK